MPDTLRSRLMGDSLVVAPGIFDMISLRMAVAAGAETVYMTGYGTVASHLGLPDAGIASYRDMVNRVEIFGSYCRENRVALVADGDTGYGGFINVAHTVRGYEAAGASAIQLEDQTFPKKCGHVEGRQVIPADEMATKIRVAADSRRSDSFLIIARTDSRTNHGLDEAISRMQQYSDAGADILFIESPETREELVQIGAAFSKPVLVNLVEGGRTPVLGHDDLAGMGFSMAIYPATGFLAAAQALDRVYARLLVGGKAGSDAELYDFETFTKLMGFEEIEELEERYRL